MASIIPYLNFDGNCREAMTFYGRVLGAEPTYQTFGESPFDVPAEVQQRVMHSHIDAGPLQLMASDLMPGQGESVGDNLTLLVHSDDEAHQTELFNNLADGGTITMPLQDTFGDRRFGMLTDRFGTHWMFNLDRPAA